METYKDLTIPKTKARRYIDGRSKHCSKSKSLICAKLDCKKCLFTHRNYDIFLEWNARLTNKFEKYHNENPRIYKEFVRIAIIAKYKKGFKHLSSKRICEQIRWETAEGGNDGYKINNNYTAYYARKMMNEYPEFKDFFRTRQLKAKRG